MALRMILVGLVASLGFEPPSMSRIESWGHTGRDWVVARVGDLAAMTSGPVLAEVGSAPAADETAVATAAVEPTAPARAAVDDLTFEVVVEGMAVRFGDELAMATPAPVPTPAPVVAAAPEVEPVVADVVDPATEPAVVAETLAAAEPAEAELPAPAPAPALVETDAPAEGRSLHRLTHAVTLTRQAMAAWASLIDGPVGGVVASRAMAH